MSNIYSDYDLGYRGGTIYICREDNDVTVGVYFTNSPEEEQTEINRVYRSDETAIEAGKRKIDTYLKKQIPNSIKLMKVFAKE